MTACALLELVHHHPGRLRVRSDALCGADRDPKASERFDRVRVALGAMGGVRSVHLNVQSGSVLVDYEPGVIDPNVLILTAAQAAGLEAPSSEEQPQGRRARPAWVAIETARKLNGFTHDLTGGRADLRVLIPMAMSSLAAYSFVVGKDRLPRWDNLAYWAYSIFQSLHAAEIREAKDRGP